MSIISHFYEYLYNIYKHQVSQLKLILKNIVLILLRFDLKVIMMLFTNVIKGQYVIIIIATTFF